MYTITLNIPKEVMGLYGSESEFVDYVSMVIAKDLYKNMGVSAMHCAKIVNMSEAEFKKCIKATEVPCFVYESETELIEKLEEGYADMLAGRVKPVREI